jgi:RES domain-containing protein
MRFRLAGCPRRTVEGRWWRMLSPRWQHEPLSGAGAARNGGRWNAKGAPALYLSFDHATAIAEYMQGLVHPGTLAPYDLAVPDILDLTDPALRAQAGVPDSLLTLPWRALRDLEGRAPDSWRLAQEAFEADFNGLRAPSALGRGVNLVLWRWNKGRTDVRVVDPLKDLSPPPVPRP